MKPISKERKKERKSGERRRRAKPRTAPITSREYRKLFVRDIFAGSKGVVSGVSSDLSQMSREVTCREGQQRQEKYEDRVCTGAKLGSVSHVGVHSSREQSTRNKNARSNTFSHCTRSTFPPCPSANAPRLGERRRQGT